MSSKDIRKREILQGTLDLMVLQTLATLGPRHGYAIAARLEHVSGGALQLNMGTLYPALMRLEQRGFLRGEWKMTENSRRARFYSITPAGRRQLAAELRVHAEMAAESARRSGILDDGASRAAALRYGGVTQAIEAQRDQRGLIWLERAALLNALRIADAIPRDRLSCLPNVARDPKERASATTPGVMQ